MKSFWISLVLFLLVIAGIAGNIVYIRHCADYMKNAAERVLLDEESGDTLTELENFWEKNRKYIGLSVSYREVDHLCEMLISLRWAYDIKDEEELIKYRLLVQDAVKEIERLEQFSVENLF